MLAAVTLILAAASGLQQRTDTTIAAPAGARLELHNFSGTVRVSTWERAEIRVRAEHGRRDRIRIEVRGGVVRVQADWARGHPSDIDYEVTVPRTMAVNVDGIETDIWVESLSGDLSAESVNGDITVQNAGGAVQLNSTGGDIRLDGGRGTISITGTDGKIGVSRARGKISIETVDGDVTLDDVDGETVEVGTTDGDVFYRGTVREGGHYRLTTHDGDVTLATREPLNATVSVATFDGSFEAAPEFAVTLTPGRHGHRQSFIVGNGSARIELESFDGDIRLERR